MKRQFLLGRRATAIVMVVGAVVLGLVFLRWGLSQPARARTESGPSVATNGASGPVTVDLSPGQLKSVKVEPVGMHRFVVEKEAIGSISFVDDRTVQVFPPYQGKLLKTFVELGDEVTPGQPLYTIESPDLIQAESALISAAAELERTARELARVKGLYGTNGVSEREVEQAAADQQTADGDLKAARDAVRVFGKTEAEVDHILAARQIDPALMVRSPVSGSIAAMNAPPGLLVQPGTPPAPYTVADLSVKWMLANVSESESPHLQPGQPVEAHVMALPGRVFTGKISKVYAAVDPSTHRVTVRSEIADPQHELRPGMLARFVIRVQDAVESVAIPLAGVVRNGDGTMAAWVTTDRKRFTQRLLKLGLQGDGQYQVLEGLQPGELAVTEGAIFLSSMLQAPPTD